MSQPTLQEGINKFSLKANITDYLTIHSFQRCFAWIAYTGIILAC